MKTTQEKKPLLGKEIHFYDELPSTNGHAMTLASQGAGEGEVVIADRQIEGRGRLGRTWQSPPGVNLYLSVILRPRIKPADAPWITLMTGVAVAQTVSRYCRDGVSIKWPNDVMAHGKKLCGILTEIKMTTGGIDFAVVGIGVNINMTKDTFDEGHRYRSTSLKEECRCDISRSEFTAALLESFEEWYEKLNTDGFHPIREAWMNYASVTGKTIEVNDRGTVRTGTVLGIDETGALLLTEEGQGTTQVLAGDITVIEE